MKKIINISLLFLFISSVTFAQKEKKEIKYDKIFYKEVKLETPDYTVIAVSGVSTDDETKFKIKIVNKTASFLSYNLSESKFIIEGKTLDVVERPLLVEPYQTESRVVNLKGAGYNKIKSYSFLVSGIYKITPGTGTIPGEDYKLPPAKNMLNIGPYVITLDKLSKETDKTAVKFNCVYNGDKTGLVYPIKAAVKMPDGKEYATTKKENPIILLKGQSDNFILSWDRMPGGKVNDMQLVDMFIKWNDAFSEADKIKINDETITLEIDEAKSNK